MTLYRALDDFVERTLCAVPGTWGKLQYIAGLRRPGGEYVHWGLARVYGDAVAREAMEEAHRIVLLQVLRTPVRDLLADAQHSADALGKPVLDFLQELSGNVPALLPGHMSGGSTIHFNSVLQALAALARVGKGTNSPAS